MPVFFVATFILGSFLSKIRQCHRCPPVPGREQMAAFAPWVQWHAVRGLLHNFLLLLGLTSNASRVRASISFSLPAPILSMHACMQWT
jgi:hypothetical protein